MQRGALRRPSLHFPLPWKGVAPLQAERFSPSPEAFSRLVQESLEEDTPLAGLLVRDQDLSGAEFRGLEFRSVTFSRCRFPGCDWSGASFTDVAFHTCDLSGGRFDGSWWLRAALTDCRGLGTRFFRSRMRQSQFRDCRLSEAHFGGAKLRETVFSGCELTGAILSECSFRRVGFDRCDLTRVSFVHSPLKGMDLTTSLIDALVLSEGGGELQGAVVDLWQAAGLARRLGVIVKELEDAPPP